MTQFLTRREMREAERNGQLITLPEAEATAPVSEEVAPQVIVAVDFAGSESFAVAPNQAPRLLTRREARLAESNPDYSSAPESTEANPEVAPYEAVVSESLPVLVPEVIMAAIEEATAETELPPTSGSQGLLSVEFTGSNLLAEPSTQSIVLDIAPEAISLPLDTLNGLSTGSIAILPDPNTGTLTGSLDGLVVDNADRVDAVTGVITMVDPVSAMDVINQRVTMAVVPDDALRKDWWQAWAYGALGVGLAVATVVATISIISAVGE